MTPPPVADQSAEKYESFEALDEVVRTTRSRSWIALATAAVLVAAAMVWAGTATIPRNIELDATLQSPGSVRIIATPATGSVLAVAQSGTRLKRGAEVATVLAADATVPTKVIMPFDGLVQDVTVLAGQGVSGGETLMVAVADQSLSPLRAAGFADSVSLPYLAPGATVSVAVSSPDGRHDGLLSGTVATVSDYPASEESAAAVLGNNSDAAELFSRTTGSLYQVVVDLGPQLQWLTPAPTRPPPPGSPVTVVIPAGQLRPLDLILGS